MNKIQTSDHLGIHLAARSTDGLASFPHFQQMTETTINQCCAEITGLQTDYSYGPFLLNTKLIPYLHKIPEDIGWGWRPYLFAVAHRLNYKMEAWVHDLFCPEAQQMDDKEERLYRMRQLEQNIRGLVLGSQIEL